ncbi:Uma2 family endonuclease [Sphingomonas sp. BK235]|uniref:Uma2 family endonuclease n=1 Tax=Sphingomonas sp. BK235 TaxID=2512131 RepID=UPI0010499241|nr:Uma2 family endonuclease [Sphingomonas sp. BK235]TCP33167.1 Uma2 family endonuclease [Sphingomonas sp. BK235]
MTIWQEIKAGTIPPRLTVADIYALTEAGLLAENEHFELIDGEIVPMGAAKSSDHERVKQRLSHLLNLSLPRALGVFVAADIAFGPSDLHEPDLAVWPRVIPSQEVRGPDLLLVIEVAVSSIGYDLRVKAPRYATFGVRDYWVVDAIRKTIRVHRAPVQGAYSDVEEYEAHECVTALLLPEVSVCLEEIDGPPARRW